jgi:enoyl-CoA hydratase/carnithine racemase
MVARRRADIDPRQRRMACSLVAGLAQEKAKKEATRRIMPQFKAFRAQVDAGVSTVTLDDPPLNLIGPTFAEDLIALIQEAEASPAYRVVVFESALDLARVPQLLIQQFLPGEFLGMLYRRLSTAPVVTIAKVAGRVRGAGNEFILACDMCFASHERAVFGQMEAGLGLLPGAGGVQHLTRLLGRQRAMAWFSAVMTTVLSLRPPSLKSRPTVG